MKLELVVLGVSGFLVYNAYHDGKYTQMFAINKKYVQMAMYAFVGFSLYLIMKKSPADSRGLLAHANSFIKYMPIDKNTSDMLGPLFDFTRAKTDLDALRVNSNHVPHQEQTPQMRRMLQSGGLPGSKRCVSETKKKYVAAQQAWKCGHCHEQLSSTFEVDHKVDLRYGGTNHVNNLIALCRECHGKKTQLAKLQ